MRVLEDVHQRHEQKVTDNRDAQGLVNFHANGGATGIDPRLEHNFARGVGGFTRQIAKTLGSAFQGRGLGVGTHIRDHVFHER